jgi:uncharacterized coiled-coil DUF342 family protein
MKLNRKQRRALKVKGVKMAVRTEDEIRKEYLDLCGRAGEVQYQIKQLEAALASFNNRLVEVNKEFVDLKESQKSNQNSEGDANASQSQTD